jgi:hypothetical protein
MGRRRYRTFAAAVGALVMGLMSASSVSAAVDCATFDGARLTRFTMSVEHAAARCLRRHPASECLDVNAAARLDLKRARTAARMEQRCPSGDAATRLLDVQSEVLCQLLAQCPPPPGTVGSMTVRVASGFAASSTEPRQLNANLGWTGLVRDVQLFEGATYTAQLSNCDGVNDTQCDFHAAVNGTRFGASAQLSRRGVTLCSTLDFVSDIDGTVDVATGDLTETMHVQNTIYNGLALDQGCPACMTADGDPQIGEAGTCLGGPNDGAPCTVEALNDPMYLSKRGASNDCQPDPAAIIGEALNVLTSTSDQVTLATNADSPNCRAPGFRDLKCLCDTCNSYGSFVTQLGDVCSSNADCPISGGQPGICGGARCFGGSNGGTPCAVHSECPGGYCYRPGMPTAPNQCDDGVCTAQDEGGICAAGPSDERCTIQRFRGCATDMDCPADGDTCGDITLRPCVPDPLVLHGVPDPPVDNIAHPTLVGTFCMGPTFGAAMNAVTGLPGPATYRWPTEITFTN